MTDDRERWALILGGSSGMGEATAITLAKAGYNIVGIHLDFRAALAHVEEVKAAIEAAGVRGALHQHERRRRREARGRAGDAPRPVRSLRGRGPPSVRPGRHALARLRLARAVPVRGPQGRRRSQEDGDDPGRHGQQPRLLGPGPVARRVPRPGLEDLRDDLGRLDPGRALVRRRLVGQGRARVAHPPAGDGARPARHRRHGQLHPGGRDRSPRRCSRSPSRRR